MTIDVIITPDLTIAACLTVTVDSCKSVANGDAVSIICPKNRILTVQQLEPI
jgi:hypothetical protein